MNIINKKKIKFLFISSFTVPDTAGSGVNAFRFARYINRKNGKATILTFNRNLQLKHNEILDQVRIIRIPYFNANLALKILSFPIAFFYFLFFIFRHHVVMIYGGKTYAYKVAIVLSVLLKKKVVFRSLLFGVDDYKSIIKSRLPIISTIKECILNSPNLYYSINPFFSRAYCEEVIGKKKILNVPQGVDIEIFYPISNQQKNLLKKKFELNQSFIIISIGFVLNRKGYHEIFDALSNLKIPFIYLIVGEYVFDKFHFLRNLNGEAEKIIKYGRLKLGEKLILTGKKKDVCQYLQIADVLIHNAMNEIPNVVYEAMACALPVISRNLYKDNNYLLENRKNCLLTDTNYPIDQAILEIYNNAELRKNLGNNAYHKILNEASFEFVYKKLVTYLYPQSI